MFDLISEGQQLLADAREQKTTAYGERCTNWMRRVESALADDQLALDRVRYATRSTETPSGIPNTVMAHWQILRGQIAVLSECYGERTKARLDTRRFWIIAVIAFLTLVAALWPIVKGWLLG